LVITEEYLMNKTINPNVVASILIVTTFIVLALLPISTEIKPGTALAQETTHTHATTHTTPLISDSASTVEYTLRTAMGSTPPMAFVAVGGNSEGVINPNLNVDVGDMITITIINGDPVAHDFRIDELNVHSDHLMDKDQEVTVTFTATTAGDFVYYCSLPGHRDSGMEGTLHVIDEVD
jgi:nitrite reductase (NO-forming)